jgi:hypothetical protein
VSDMNLFNKHALGCCADFEYLTGATFRDLVMAGGGGLVIGKALPPQVLTNVDIGIIGCCFLGKLADYSAAIGLALRGQGKIDNYRAYQCVGAQLANAWEIARAHMEVCTDGIILGVNPDGTGRDCHGQYSSLTFEACLRSITAKNGSAGVFSDVTILGEFQTTPGQSDLGIDLQARRCTFKNLGIGGTFTTGCVKVYDDPAATNTFENENVQNHSGPAWVKQMATATVTSDSATYPW